MSPTLGWVLAAAGLAVGWVSWGWQGLVLAATLVVFWLVLQFNRTLRVLRRAGAAPLGHVDSAVMLNARLRQGLPLAAVLVLAGSLGRKVADDPETYEWRDPGGASLRLVLRRGRSQSWSLERT